MEYIDDDIQEIDNDNDEENSMTDKDDKEHSRLTNSMD